EGARTVDIGHGRIEQRHITTSGALLDSSTWPGLAQVFEWGRHVITQKTGKERTEVVYGVTSLGPERATPRRLLHMGSSQRKVANGKQVRWGAGWAVGCRRIAGALWQHPPRHGGAPQHRDWPPKMGGSYQHRGGLSPVGSSAAAGVGSHRDCIGKLNDPGDCL